MPSTLKSLLCALFLALVACADGHTPTNAPDYLFPSDGVAQFSVSPVDLSQTPILTPLGNLGPPGHVLPTDHVYFYQTNFDLFPPVMGTTKLPVLAPATGIVSFVLLQSGGDYKVMFQCTSNFGYYLDHLVMINVLTVGTTVHAGDTLGTTSPGGSLDLGAWDLNVTNPGLLNPNRHGPASLHVVSPWKYFTEPLRSTIYAKIRRVADVSDKDGRTDFGIAGRLVGNWYDESVPNTQESDGPVGWPKTVAFVYDYFDPRLIRISIGGTIATPGVWTITPDAPLPANVSVATGKVAYRLMYTGSTTVQSGLMLVQLVDDGHLKIEVFSGSQAGTAEFTANARTYVR